MDPQEQDLNYFGWGEITEETVFPSGIFHMRVRQLEDTKAGTGKRMFVGHFDCLAPPEFAGMTLIENYVTGTEENPLGINKGARGSKSLMKMLARTQIQPSKNMAEICQRVMGAELIAVITQYEEKGEGPYKGQKQNRIADYHKIGEKQPGVAATTAPGMAVNMTAPPAPTPNVAASPAPPPMATSPVPVPQPTAPAPQVANPATQVPQVPVAAPPGPPAPMQTDPAQFVPTAPAPAQTVPQAPGVPEAPAPTPAATPGVAPTTTVPCTICTPNQQIPVDQFGEHIKWHAEQSQM